MYVHIVYECMYIYVGRLTYMSKVSYWTCNIPFRIDWLASKPQLSTALAPHHWDNSKTAFITSSFYVGVDDSNSRPLPTDPSPQPRRHSFFWISEAERSEMIICKHFDFEHFSSRIRISRKNSKYGKWY